MSWTLRSLRAKSTMTTVSIDGKRCMAVPSSFQEYLPAAQRPLFAFAIKDIQTAQDKAEYRLSRQVGRLVTLDTLVTQSHIIPSTSNTKRMTIWLAGFG